MTKSKISNKVQLPDAPIAEMSLSPPLSPRGENWNEQIKVLIIEILVIIWVGMLGIYPPTRKTTPAC